jgi:hypothetical protein
VNPPPHTHTHTPPKKKKITTTKEKGINMLLRHSNYKLKFVGGEAQPLYKPTHSKYQT